MFFMRSYDPQHFQYIDQLHTYLCLRLIVLKVMLNVSVVFLKSKIKFSIDFCVPIELPKLFLMAYLKPEKID